MLKFIRLVFGLAFAPCLGGCTYGFLYSDMTTPLVTNMDMTPANGDHAISTAHELRYPLSALSLQWSSRAIGDAALQNNLSTIYYADQRTIAILGGIWKSSAVHVVGKKG